MSLNADDLDFVHPLEYAALDTTGHDCATTFNVEHVFDGHQERLIDRAVRHRDVIIDRVHECEDLPSPGRLAVERLERAALDDRGLVARKFILA